ncbi:CBS domain-containing protein [Tunicatimonas pelagia]|uniref:CBS domain-containing protein n=1 Tax=Tunicatimonas pelagia TaxID=931531 RepID=UPI002666AE20|nr:CBS domain-containing protein [Tunicatimonas pelagia]WKN42945.1 CBS domain-containing protein [Tunicatimonas pelagia]
MSTTSIKIIDSETDKQRYTSYLLKDIQALERMLTENKFEQGVQRIGAEQEMVFINEAFRPAFIGPKVKQRMNRPYVTTEYAQFNLEINLSPILFNGSCLTELSEELTAKIEEVEQEALRRNTQVLLTGILPTIRKSDTSPESMTPEPRYQALLENVNRLRGQQYEFNIQGLDELITRDNPSTFGGCMTSLQLHLQVDADKMVDMYNWAQLIAAPTLACATYSPVFLGKRLWHETRIALLRQTTDTRKPYSNLTNEEARVSFGNDWLRESVAEVFHDDVAGYKAYLTKEFHENALEVLDRGGVPKLEALNFHNGTIYRWNRICYGVFQGKPHLRIENRVLPAGPTIEDELANTAFWLGLMNALPERYQGLQQKIPFDRVKTNFLKAAQLGIEVEFEWLDRKLISARELILEELLPLAHEGLKKAGVNEKDYTHYLDIIRQRTESGRTGSRWILKSYEQLLDQSITPDEAWVAITAGMLERQQSNQPVHTWELASVKEAGDWKNRFWRLDQVMTKTIYTVEENDIVNLAAHIMSWKKIGHIPVERNGELVGIITKDSIINYYASNSSKDFAQTPIRNVMITNLVTAQPDMLVADAIDLIIKSDISCLPVVEGKKLVGIITEHDFVHISRHLYQELMDNVEPS